jgi:organic hydroperoxide reductase OsmC/OhrA
MADVFASHLEWSGAAKGPTLDPATFSRELNATIAGMPLQMSAAPGFRGDASRANPEQLFIASLSACHALTYLYLAAKQGVVVTGYTDDAEGWLQPIDGKLVMARIRLRPRITLGTGNDETKARELVGKAHKNCFISNSVTARVEVDPTFEVQSALPALASIRAT